MVQKCLLRPKLPSPSPSFDAQLGIFLEIKQMPLWVISHPRYCYPILIKPQRHLLLMIPIYLFIYLFICLLLLLFVCFFLCRTQDNSKKEWEFRKAVTILTYCNCHPIPVPLNIISTLAVAIPGLIKKKAQEKDEADAKSVLVRCWQDSKKSVKTLKFVWFGEWAECFFLDT